MMEQLDQIKAGNMSQSPRPMTFRYRGDLLRAACDTFQDWCTSVADQVNLLASRSELDLVERSKEFHRQIEDGD